MKTPEEKREYDRAYREKHRDEIRARHHERYLRDRTQILEYQRKLYRAAHKDDPNRVRAYGPRRRWTKQEEKELMDHYLAGETRKQIAEALGRKEAAVGRHMTELVKKGLLPGGDRFQRTWSYWTDEDLDTLRDLIRAGKNIPEIAKAMPERTELAVRRKIGMMYGTSAMIKVRKIVGG